MRPRLGALVCVCFWAGMGAVRAEILLQKVSWQTVKRASPAARPEILGDLKEIRLVGPKSDGKLRAKLTLANRGPNPVEAVLLRYSVTASLVPLTGALSPVWAVPFLVDERRIPKVGPNETKEVPLDLSILFGLYLKRTYRSGFVPKELKIQIMVDPHRGDNLPIKTIESVLPVAYEAQP